MVNPPAKQAATAPALCRGWCVTAPSAQWTPTAMTLSDVQIPAPRPSQVRVKVHAASVNPVDWKRTMFPSSNSKGGSDVAGATALPGFKNMQHRPMPYPYPYIVGVDGAGVIESVGPAVQTCRVGDRVMFHSSLYSAAGGSMCEYALAEESVVVPIPESVSFEEAAAIPCAVWTAYLALFDKLRIEQGRSIFIDGASGAAGSAAVQLAHHMGLFVFASCSASNAAYVQGLGADVVLNYRRGAAAMIDEVLAATDDYGVDYYLAVTNTQDAEALTDVLRFGGAVCLLSGVLVPTSDVLFRRQLSVHHVFLNGLHDDPLTKPQLRYMGERVAELYANRAFAMDLEVVPFDEAAAALNRSATGKMNHKKLVVQVVSP